MQPSANGGGGLIRWWFAAAVVGMGALAAGWLSYEFWRLLFQPGIMGAVDLLLRRDEVHRWFGGLPVYSELRTATYPPASMVLLWPLVGWLDATASRWLWAISTIGALAWLVWLVVHASGARTRFEIAFVALLPLASYAAGAAIGNGQLIVQVLPILLAAVLLLRSNELRGWKWRILAAGLLLASLVKPTLATPFFWIALFAAGSPWPVVFASAGYVGLTLLAAQFQPTPLPILLREWLARSQITATGSSGANLHAWLAALGLGDWIPAASLLVLLFLGAWVYRHRHADLWLLLGVTSIVTNMWSYHLWYDDLIVVLAGISVFRLARSVAPTRPLMLTRALLAALVLTSLAPGGLYTLPPPWNGVYVWLQTVVRVAVLVYLIGETRRQSALSVAHPLPAPRASTAQTIV
ncbi:MAG: glycosyltransferase 87 family protein [Chloroflexota bacterium]